MTETKTTVDVLTEAADYIEANGLAHEDFVKIKGGAPTCFCLAGTLSHVASDGSDYAGLTPSQSGFAAYESAVQAVIEVGGIRFQDNPYGSPLKNAERGIWEFNDRKVKVGDRERFAFQKRDAVRLLRKAAKAVAQ